MNFPIRPPSLLVRAAAVASCLLTLVTARSAPPPLAAAQVHETRGVVRRIAPDQRTAVIRHEAIPGFMPAMTMELNVRTPAELRDISPGDIITFRIVSDDQSHWIDGLRRVGRATGTETNALPAEAAGGPKTGGKVLELQPGDPMPDAEFLGETGKPIRLSEFRGRALAFTFFFTRCPLPEFCPLMSRNFARARELLRADPGAPANWSFLSISFDPEFDRPAVLAGYGANQRGQDTADWVFAAASSQALRDLAPKLGLMLSREGGTISHNLRTVVLDTRGRIHRQFDGNRWKAGELAAALREAATVPANPP